MTDLERLLVHYGCDRFCYNNNDCNHFPKLKYLKKFAFSEKISYICIVKNKLK